MSRERMVTVEKNKLLNTLKVNKANHVEKYKESMSGYQELATEQLEKEFVKAKKRLENSVTMIKSQIDNFNPDEPLLDNIVLLDRVAFTLRAPKNYESSYDVAIEMAEWEVGDTIELTQSEFQKFVMDNWDWKEDFLYLNKSYVGFAKKHE